MRAWSSVRRCAGAMLLAIAAPALAAGQAAPAAPPAPPALSRIAMVDAVRLALERNHQLRAQRLNVDLSKADEITAALKPNPTLTSTNENFPIFSPSDLFSWDNFANNLNFVESVSYLFERGGKRAKRTQVARDTTTAASQTVTDNERQLEFQTEQAFISVLLANSTVELAREDLKNFANVVDVNRERLRAGDLAEADFYKISLQTLQFEQDLSSAEVAVVQAKAALRQNVGYESLTDDFEVAGDLNYRKYAVTLDDLKRDALIARPDWLAAQTGVTLAQHTQDLAFANRARDVTGGLEYDRAGPLNSVGFSVSVDLPFHDRNQGNIAHAKVAIAQATELQDFARSTVLTDVVNAYATFQTSEKVLTLYQSGYLDQAKQSLDITTYVYQQGSGTLLDLLDAERTYRSTQLAYRQALAAYMTSVQQINQAVGRQVMQ
ncbi:MAG TPA: TolC family protein [Vicinamibacterales bacterium]|nr:TolC family protein [Vicinamibacterales bacterium]